MKISNKLQLLLVAAALIFTGVASTAQTAYHARLSHMPRTPQTVDTITGMGQVTLSLSGNLLTVSGSFSGMSSAATMVHIHNGPPAQPGPVVHSLEISLSTSGEISGTVELSDAQVEELKKNSLYIQVHSAGNPAGEIRGWIFN